MITAMNLKSVRSLPSAVTMVGLLGYDARALPYDAEGELGIVGNALRLSSHGRPNQGYGVVLIETDAPLGPGKALGRRLIQNFHDRPLALVGRRNGSGWDEYSVVRPRVIAGGAGTVAVARLTVDPHRPTAHDVSVLREVAWRRGPDPENQARIDRAFDVERVTKRFFLELRAHHELLEGAVSEAAAADAAVAGAVRRAGGLHPEDGPWRVSLRVLTQVLFCYFLQRKGVLGTGKGWLSDRYLLSLREGDAHRFYTNVLEPLFYEALAAPEASRAPEWREVGVPFLNGGLFESPYGEVSLPLPGELFSTDDGLLGFLDGWTFTVAEDMPDDAEVAVDPEMLGKVFENLIGDEEARRQGTVYTPRPVVQFMCREALVPYLRDRAVLEEAEAREVLTADDPRIDAPTAEAIDRAMQVLRVIDPAVGSGAFLIGMLGETVRLRGLCHQAMFGARPDVAMAHAWKLHAIEHSLFGVDINPTAVELCRLRLWLALIVDLPPGADPDPLPNLEYRTVCADSLPDFLAGVAFQSTRGGLRELGFDQIDASELTDLRGRYFAAADPEVKAELRDRLADLEDDLLGGLFRRATRAAEEQARSTRPAVSALGAQAQVDVAALKGQFQSSDRVFPLFLPGFHAPEVFAPEDSDAVGWDIAIMNPPYVGRKEVRQRLDPTRVADLERHYGRTFDLMVHFGFRALELVRPGGVLSMIFNDSIFTSTDAAELRRALAGGEYEGRRGWVRVAARTRCFEGKAVNGGVVVAVRDGDPEGYGWIENHGRPPADLLAASSPNIVPPGESERFAVPADALIHLPHRPLFRPSDPARHALALFERCAYWPELGRWAAPDAAGGDWPMLSETRRLERWKERARREGRLDGLVPGRDFVLLGLVSDGGQGLATADDRRFLAAIEGTSEADAARAMADRLESALPDLHRGEYERRRAAGRARADALLDLSLLHTERELGWPRIGLIQVAALEDVRTSRLTKLEVEKGITAGPRFVPFEKGDASAGGGGARWRRDNPLVIDWSAEAVGLLRRRAAGSDSHRKPYFRNEQLWGQGGVTWNRVASFLRVRDVPEGAIFADMAPTIRPSVHWLSQPALMALLNTEAIDFILRTFLGSRMHIEIGDVRRLPVPVLTEGDALALDELGRTARDAKADADAGGRPGSLLECEAEVNRLGRELYGFRPGDDLWVVR